MQALFLRGQLILYSMKRIYYLLFIWLGGAAIISTLFYLTQPAKPKAAAQIPQSAAIDSEPGYVVSCDTIFTMSAGFTYDTGVDSVRYYGPGDGSWVSPPAKIRRPVKKVADPLYFDTDFIPSEPAPRNVFPDGFTITNASPDYMINLKIDVLDLDSVPHFKMLERAKGAFADTAKNYYRLMVGEKYLYIDRDSNLVITDSLLAIKTLLFYALYDITH
jgi:hypothetical protein